MNHRSGTASRWFSVIQSASVRGNLMPWMKMKWAGSPAGRPLGGTAKSCSPQSWGWPGAWHPAGKLQVLFIYVSGGCTCLLQSKHSSDLEKIRINMKYTSFVCTKWPAGSMFFHLFLIIISKPNISKFSTIERCSDISLLYTEAADTGYSVAAYVCVFRTLSGKWARLHNAVWTQQHLRKHLGTSYPLAMYNVQPVPRAETLISSLYVKRQDLFLCCCFNYLVFSDTKFRLNGGISPTCFLFTHDQKEYAGFALCNKSIMELSEFSDQN